MADVSIKYNSGEIASWSETGTKTCKTRGKYCADDIIVEYIKPTPSLEAKVNYDLTVGTAITPSTGYDGMSSYTLQSSPATSITIPTDKDVYTLANSGDIVNLSNQYAGPEPATISTLTNGGGSSARLGTISTLTNQQGGTITNLNNNANATITSLSNSGTITGAANSGTIGSLYNSGTIYNYYTSSSAKVLNIKKQTGASYAINAGIIYNTSGTSSAYGGYIYDVFNDSYAKIGSITTVANSIINRITNSGTITGLENKGTIGDSTAGGYNGLYGTGTIYVTATNSSTPASSNYRLVNLTLKAGTSSSSMGAYLDTLNINSYATINTINNYTDYTENGGTINHIYNGTLGGAVGTINSLVNYSAVTTIDNEEGTITTLNNNGTISTEYNTGTINNYWGSGTLNTKAQTGTSYDYTVSQIINTVGNPAEMGGLISTLDNRSYAKITTINNDAGGTIDEIKNGIDLGSGFYDSSIINKITNGSGSVNYGIIKQINNPIYVGTIGDSTTASSSTTGQNGLYGGGTTYLAATGVSSPSSSSTYATGTITLKAGTSTYYGSYLGTLNVNSYATINNLSISSNGYINTFSNSGYIGRTSSGTNSGYIGTSSYPVKSSGYIYLKGGNNSTTGAPAYAGIVRLSTDWNSSNYTLELQYKGYTSGTSVQSFTSFAVDNSTNYYLYVKASTASYLYTYKTYNYGSSGKSGGDGAGYLSNAYSSSTTYAYSSFKTFTNSQPMWVFHNTSSSSITVYLAGSSSTLTTSPTQITSFSIPAYHTYLLNTQLRYSSSTSTYYGYAVWSDIRNLIF